MKRFNYFSIPAHWASLLDIWSMCGFQDMFSFNRRTSNVKLWTLSKGISLISKIRPTSLFFLLMAWNITSLVFLTFEDNLFTAYQSQTLANSPFILSGDIDGILSVLLNVVSSTYRIKLKYLVQFWMSFMYIRNNNGPRMEQYGRLVDIERKPSISAYWLRPVR